MDKQYFANYKNGQVSINSHRFCDAQVTDINDIKQAKQKQSLEILTASINTENEHKDIQALIYN